MKRTPIGSVTQIPDERQRRGQLVLRVLPVLLIPILAILLSVLLMQLTSQQPLFSGARDFPAQPAQPPRSPAGAITVIGVFITSTVVLVRMGKPTVSALMLIGAWTLVATVGLINGHVFLIGPALFVIPICAAGLLLDAPSSMVLAGVATLMVAGQAWLSTGGHLAAPGSFANGQVAPPPVMIAGFWSGLFWSVAVLTSLLAGGLQKALSQSRAQAASLRALSDELEARVAEQTAALLAQEREAGILEERTRLARDIHDTLAQGLTGVVLQLGAAEMALAAAPDESREHLALARKMAREALAEARRSVWNLRAPALERGDLEDALAGLCSRPLGQDITATFERRGEPWPLSPAIESTLLRVGQEALVNVVKHAGATRAEVVLSYAPDAVELSVRDDGVGFSEEVVQQAGGAGGPWGGFGLQGMRERVVALSGTLDLKTDAGAQVTARIPRPQPAAQQPALAKPGEKGEMS